jgi:hypothetical protein
MPIQLRTRRPKSNGQRDHVVPTPAVVSSPQDPRGHFYLEWGHS